MTGTTTCWRRSAEGVVRHVWSSLRNGFRRLALRVATMTGSEMLAEITRRRLGLGRTKAVTQEAALRNSAVWACLQLRAGLVSTMPVDEYRRLGQLTVNMPTSPVLVTPGALHIGGEPVGVKEWMAATQFDLDRAGNCFGLIVEKNALGLAARIDLVPLGDVTVVIKDGKLKYRIGRTEYEPSEVWHERQYVQAGLPVGLSPVAHAALALGEYASAQELAIEWYSGSARPSIHLKNTAKTLQPGEAEKVKDRYRAMVEDGGLFVTGADWEFSPIQAVQAQASYLEAKKFGLADIARFFGCPADLIDAAVSGSSVTYANITQRNLQFLVMQLGPAVSRREDALSRLTARPRFVKLNRSALLAMDPATQATTIKTKIEARVLTPDEARAIDDRLPLTEADYAQFDRLFGARQAAPKAQSSSAALTDFTAATTTAALGVLV